MKVTLGQRHGPFGDGTELSAVLALDGTLARSDDYRIVRTEESTGNARSWIEVQEGIVIKTWFGSGTDSYPDLPERYASAVIVKDDVALDCDLGPAVEPLTAGKSPPRNWPLGPKVWATLLTTMSQIAVR